MSVSIEGLVRAAQAELAGLDTKLRRRQHVVIRKVLEQQGEDLRVQEKGKWGAATRQRLLLFLGHGARTMAAAQAVDLGAGLFDVVGASQGHAARWLATLDQHYLGELRPYAWTSKAWAIATGQEHLETRLRAFHGSFLRYGALVVGDVERALGKLALGASWDEVRALVAKATAEQTAGKSWMVERIVRTEAAHAYSAAAWRAMLEEDTPGSPMLKKLVAVHDLVTGKDSMLLDGQIRPVREPFFDEWNGRHYMHPPNRPNDREIVVPWRASYGDHRKARGKRARRMMPEAKPTRAPVEDRKRQIVAGFDAVKAAQRTLGETVGGLPFDLDAKLATIFASENGTPKAGAARLETSPGPRRPPAAAAAERARKAAAKAARAAELAAAKEAKRREAAARKTAAAEAKRAAARAKAKPASKREAVAPGPTRAPLFAAARNEAWRSVTNVAADVTDTKAVASVEKWMSRHDPRVLEIARARGVTLQVRNYITDDPIFAENRGVRPRGWPEGKTWDSLAGGARGTRAVLAVKGIDGGRRGLGVDVNGSTATHEVGHAIDKTCKTGRFCQDPRFLRAYAAARKPNATGRTPLTSWAFGDASYYEQEGDAGPSEWWAEVWSRVHSPYDADVEAVEKHFPGLADLMSKMVAENYGL